jgi:D-alanyl-D-alanine carboxypeptidase
VLHAAVVILVLEALTQSQSARIDAIVRAVMSENHIAGLSLGIARRCTIVALRGYGYRDVAHDVRADGYTIYRIGSITKQFTAAAIMQEVERGTVSLDAPLASYVPQIDGVDATVSVRNALAQISGLPSYSDVGITNREHLEDTDPTPRQIWSLVANEPLLFPSGTAWSYSNTNYLALGMVLDRVTATAYPQLVHDRFTVPLHLVSTRFGDPAGAENIATGYTWQADHMMPVPYRAGLNDFAYAAGGLTSNAVDLLQWLEALRGGHVVSPAAFTQMTTSARLRDGRQTSYGFGFFVRDWYGHRAIEHGGNIDGFTADDALVLDDGLELALLSNCDGTSLVPLTKSIVAILDPPTDPNLYAGAPRPAENENPQVTSTVASLLSQLQRGTIDRTLLTAKLSASLPDARLRAGAATLAALGPTRLIEFIERSHTNQLTYEKYRVTFNVEQWWVTLGYRDDGKIDALFLSPDNP